MANARHRVLALAGIVAPVLFVLTFTVLGFFHEDYDALSMYVSALSLGRLGWIQVANFIVFGLLCGLFGVQAAAMFATGRASRAGPLLLWLSSVCFFLSGPFVMDSMGTPRAAATVHGTVHGILGAMAFVLMPVTCFVFYARFRKDHRWAFFKGWTLAAGTLTTCTVVVFSAVSRIPSLLRDFAPWLGLLQRSVIVPYMAWLFAFAVAAWRPRVRRGD
jgi:hypothetical protein